MPCLFAVFALATPRLVILCLYFLSTWFNGLFPSPLYPVLGFIFLPTTLLWYTAVVHWFGASPDPDSASRAPLTATAMSSSSGPANR